MEKIQFKKGWNLVEYTLLEKEDWNTDTDQGSLAKTINLTSVLDIPSDINWYVKFMGN